MGAVAFDCFLMACEVFENALYLEDREASEAEALAGEDEGGEEHEFADQIQDAAEYAALFYAMERAGGSESVTQEQQEQGRAKACDVIRGFVPRPRYARLVKAR